MTQKPTILLVAQPGHLRDSLQVLLTALSGGRLVVLANSWPVDTPSVMNGQPDLVVVVPEPGSQETEDNPDVAQIKTRWPLTRLAVLVDTEWQRQDAAAGAIGQRNIGRVFDEIVRHADDTKIARPQRQHVGIAGRQFIAAVLQFEQVEKS